MINARSMRSPLHVGDRSDAGNRVTPDHEHVGVGTGGYPALRFPSPMALAAMVVAARRACSGVIPISGFHDHPVPSGLSVRRTRGRPGGGRPCRAGSRTWSPGSSRCRRRPPPGRSRKDPAIGPGLACVLAARAAVPAQDRGKVADSGEGSVWACITRTPTRSWSRCPGALASQATRGSPTSGPPPQLTRNSRTHTPGNLVSNRKTGHKAHES
jgi:hypothetical protein